MLVLKAFRAVACLNQQFIHGDNELRPPPLPPTYSVNEKMQVSQPDLLFHKVFHLRES